MESVVRCIEMGAADYLPKPFDPVLLRARLKSSLAAKKLHDVVEAHVAEIEALADQLRVRNRFIQETFGRYLSDAVVSEILESPDGLRLGGEKRTVTMLMSDLRGFSAMAERLAPEQVVRVINNYLGTMADVILAHDGTIDEFIGDSVLGFFGAPVARGDDARRAVACALAMQKGMERVNRQNREEGLPAVEMGIAVHTGDVVVGNIGSEKRAKYGAVGSHVNLTARIESYTCGGQVLICRTQGRGS
jgi:class 3 adenylate cyclase